MPKGTVKTEPQHYKLESLPGGYVKLKQLSYGQMLERREMATKLSMEQAQEKPGVKKNEPDKINVQIIQRAVAAYEFAACVVEHNIEDEDGTLLNFGNTMTLDILDPRIGDEISKRLAELNGETDDMAFAMPSGESSSASQLAQESSDSATA